MSRTERFLNQNYWAMRTGGKIDFSALEGGTQPTDQGESPLLKDSSGKTHFNTGAFLGYSLTVPLELVELADQLAAQRLVHGEPLDRLPSDAQSVPGKDVGMSDREVFWSETLNCYIVRK